MLPWYYPLSMWPDYICLRWLRKFATMSTRRIFLWFQVIVLKLCWTQWIGKVPSSLIFWVCRRQVLFSTLADIGLLRVSVSFCVKFCKLCIFHEICPFRLSCYICWWIVIWIVPYFSFKICRSCSDTPSFSISDIDNYLHSLFFFSLPIQRGIYTFCCSSSPSFHWFMSYLHHFLLLFNFGLLWSFITGFLSHTLVCYFWTAFFLI